MSLVISDTPGLLLWCAGGCPCMCLSQGSTGLAFRMWSLAVIHPVAPVEFDYFLNYIHTWLASVALDIFTALFCRRGPDTRSVSPYRAGINGLIGVWKWGSTTWGSPVFRCLLSCICVYIPPQPPTRSCNDAPYTVFLSLTLSTDNKRIYVNTILAGTRSKAVGGAVISGINSTYQMSWTTKDAGILRYRWNLEV